MYIALSNSDPAPLYEQIKKQIIDKVRNGKLPSGEMLPSIRSLAKELEISVITVKKAYDDLEAEGYIVTRPGKGSCVAEAGAELIREGRLKAVQTFFEQAIEGCRDLRMEDAEIEEMFRILLKEQ